MTLLRKGYVQRTGQWGSVAFSITEEGREAFETWREEIRERLRYMETYLPRGER
jgi:DNA-binding PadR family transcriptional regulator